MIKNRHANCFHLEFIRFNFPNPKIKIFKKLKSIQFILKNYLKNLRKRIKKKIKIKGKLINKFFFSFYSIIKI